MATHSSVLAWRIPGMVEPGELPSMGLYILAQTREHAGAVDTCKAGVPLSSSTFPGGGGAQAESARV